MLLVLSSKNDLAADYLILGLLERGLPYFRVNSEELSSVKFRFEQNGSVATVIALDGKKLDVGKVTCVWYRRGLHPRVDQQVPSSLHSFVAGEIRHAWHGVLFGLNAMWVNPIDRVAIAEHKILQLQLARDLGFLTPKTIVSSVPADLIHFIRNVGRSICKPIYHGLVIDDEKRESAFTRRVIEQDLEDHLAVSVAPVLLQEEVTRRADLRITVIGDEFFGVRITSPDRDIVDWRKPGLGIDYSTFEVGQDLRHLCQELLRRLGLVYGAFDFIEKPDGKVVFLEVNPTGEWAWLEDRLGLPMRAAFFRLFYGRN
jgi:hypothetical protein